jgi:toxin-antitoxin system PIN domain toxin
VTSVDTNLLLPAVERNHASHGPASQWLTDLSGQAAVAISEFVLLELYVLLRNPAVVRKPLTPARAADVCTAFRRHPTWRIVGFPVDSRGLHDELWSSLREPGLARRRAYDLRLALTLRRYGVTDFATVNVKDFAGLGFHRVWNPLAEEAPR